MKLKFFCVYPPCSLFSCANLYIKKGGGKYFQSLLEPTSLLPPPLLSISLPLLPRFFPLPLFLHMISPESCSSGCTSRPTKLINMLYMIDPSACPVYIVCAPLRQEALTFHTQGSSPSLSRIIVQLMSRLQPIRWEGFAYYSRGTHSDLPKWGWQGEDGMFSSSVHKGILSLPLAEGFFIKGTRCGRQQCVVM